MDWWRSSKSICIKEKSHGKQDILPSNINLHTRENVFIQKILKRKGENKEEGKDDLHIFQVKGVHHNHIGVCVCVFVYSV